MVQMFHPATRSLFEPTADLVAQTLLGYWLVRQTPDGPCGGPIVETEAYLINDPACHSFGGKTRRNQVMWGIPGKAYVYFIYGNHWCVNTVCQPFGIAEAVLIRAIEATLGAKIMLKNRPVANVQNLTNGPGKLCEALAIDRVLDGVDLCDVESPLIIAQNPSLDEFRRQRGPVVVGKRIGISKAADLPLRFYLSKSAFLSRKHRT